MSFPSHIFKAYDIRGLVEGELTEDLAYKIGRAFVVLLRSQGEDFSKKSVVVGRDMRLTSMPFQAEVMQAITDEGVNVIDIGLVSTPLFNFACAHYPEHAGGIMITASHNPAEYNGFKMTLGTGLPIGKNNGMEQVKELVQKGEFSPPVATPGSIDGKHVLTDYLDRILSVVDTGSVKPLKIVIDAGNGMAKVTFPDLVSRLPISVEYLYLEPDGRFPNHEANPLKVETLKDLQKKVVEVGADFGFALDGDADRIGLVDEKGQVVEASYVGALVGLEVLKKNPGSLMLYDLRSSQIVPEVWEAAGAKTQKCMVGHALIKKMMKELGAIFASELSLHLYFQSMYGVESTDLALLYFLDIVSRENKPLSELVAPLKKYFHSGEVNFEVHNKDEIIKKLEEKYVPEALEKVELDGLWLRLPWGWFSVRASNTEPVLRLNLEAESREVMEEKVREISAVIEGGK